MKKFGLIGNALTNTFSKKFFEERFLSLNLTEHSFENYQLENINGLESLLKNNPELCGLMVTVPFKQEVIKFLNEIDSTAENVGAVNCIKIVDGSKFIDHGLSSDALRQTANHSKETTNTVNKIHSKPFDSSRLMTPTLIGYNTDVFGFENSLKPFINNFNGSALILGTGGAAKAVAYVLSKLKIEFIFVSRKTNPDNHREENEISYSSLSKKIIEDHHLIINCTPIGMLPNFNEAPAIPYEFISNDHFVYDLIYHPKETLFLKNCKAQGAKTKNGLEMLHLQAEEGLRIFLS